MGISTDHEAAAAPRRRLCAMREAALAPPLSIALVNNMSDTALASTERQFRALLAEASVTQPIRLSVFALPDMPRSDIGRRYLQQQAQPIEALYAGGFDAVIVTGAEPRTPKLQREPYWKGMARLVEWAEANTISTIWSCLAAHCAVLHMDAIERLRLTAKLSGIFDCARPATYAARTAQPIRPRGGLANGGLANGGLANGGPANGGPWDALLDHLPEHWPVPHSRFNGLSADALSARGYEILSLSEEAGVDSFARQGNSLFVFFQGHPEYDAQTLSREYRRDLGRFRTGAYSVCPEPPRHYFDERTECAIARLRAQVVDDVRLDPEALFTEATFGAALRHRWRGAAAVTYANWLAVVAARRGQSASGSDLAPNAASRLRATAPLARPVIQNA